MRWRKTKPSEHAEQVAYFQYVERMAAMDWRYKTIFAVPNGGKRHIGTARKLKSEGVKSGVWDICIPYRSGQYIGAWIEMKVPGNKLTDKQLEWGGLMQDTGHLLHVCYTALEAIEFTEFYFNLQRQKEAA